MIGASIADLHLGFRAYAAVVGGRNAREVDVERAWVDVVATVCDPGCSPWGESPRILTIAGDIFHHPRVSTHAMKAFRDGLITLGMHDIVVVVVAGNHDAGRTADVLSPIVLPSDLANVVIVTEPQVVPVDFGTDGCAVHCFPFTVLTDTKTYKLNPTKEWGTDILLVHAAVKADADGDELPHFYGGLGALDIGKEADRFDVVAVGDFHEFRRLHPDRLAFYSGSIERTSSDIWSETADKGVVFWNTESSGEDALHFVPTWTRPMHDYDMGDFNLPPDSTAADLNQALAKLLEPIRDARLSAIDGNIARLKVSGFPREQRDQIDWSMVRELKQAALHFQLDLRWSVKDSVGVRSGRDTNKRQALSDDAEAFFADDPADVRDLCLSYLKPEGGDA